MRERLQREIKAGTGLHVPLRLCTQEETNARNSACPTPGGPSSPAGATSRAKAQHDDVCKHLSIERLAHRQVYIELYKRMYTALATPLFGQ